MGELKELIKRGIASQVAAKVRREDGRLIIEVPEGVRRSSTDVVRFPEVIITPQEARLADEPPMLTLIHDRNAYKKHIEVLRSKAAYAEALKRLLAEREQRYRHGLEYSLEELAVIEKRMKTGPGNNLPIGMIKRGSRLIEVLKRQRQERETLGLDDWDYAMAISKIFEAYLRAGAEGRLEKDNFGYFAREGELKIYRYGSVGHQPCPFDCQPTRRFIVDYVVINPEAKTAMWLADIHDHFPKHGFYEEDTFLDTDFSDLPPEVAMRLGIEALMARLRVDPILRPFALEGYRFVNLPYFLPLKETAEFLGIKKD